MNTIKTALLAGALASLSTLAFAQAGAPTEGADLGSVYRSNTYVEGGGSYAQAPRHLRTASHTTVKQHETTGSGIPGVLTGHGSAD